ncbi:MAG: DUF3391 domain-containing protein [Xanthomonadaceae bacterium]|nr:DUF3391 domain-containing protein [Xanthomonadaceae bacterium]
MPDPSLEFIDIDRLRVGVFVQLDLHWTQHPFQFSSFLIRNPAQIEQLRGLGLHQVRWSRQRSEVEPLPEPGVQPAWVDGPATGAGNGMPAGAGAGPPTGAAEAGPPAPDRVAPAPAPVPAQSPALARRRALLADQQASLERCERGFAEASRQFRQILQNARAHPLQAREVAEGQVEGMVEQVLETEDVAIRLLSEKAGQETTLHPMNVSVLSILLGRSLGLDPVQIRHLGVGALLHDIGKLELPDRLRWRDSAATAAERRMYQEHPAHGLALGRRMGLPAEVLEVIAQHHEQVDGRGYPAGLQGEAIHPLARVVALVNQYDNLCSPANPAQAFTPHDALALIFARQREAFDATTLAAFIRMMGVYPPGSVLQLNDARYAIVASVNSERPLKPRIIVHDPAVPADEALVLDLEQHPELGIQRAVKPLQLPRAVFDYLSPRKRLCYFFERSPAAPANGGELG